jgi:hypothetical protein
MIAAGEMARRGDHVAPPDLPIPDGVDPASLMDLLSALPRVSDMQRRALILRYYMGLLQRRDCPHPRFDPVVHRGSTVPFNSQDADPTF